MKIKKIMVIGAGQMGGGIAQVAAQAGLQVILNDIDMSMIEQRVAFIDKTLTRNVEKGKITAEEQQEILARLVPSTDLQDAADVDFVVEAATENMALKETIFRKLDEVARPDVILATNTSSLPITEIAAVTSRPESVIGMHFMNPVPVMILVEVIRGIATSDQVYAIVEELAVAMGKKPVEVNDYPGFISNRVLMPMINEAIFCVYEGVADPEAVDQVMKLGMNHPMGPLTLADFIGLDTCL
ncbi:MAG: 3-hydroxyacyl-CoA dehydrogenase NAD-binding domain-containing protein, partial [Desulfuromonadales bacterium]|nr:3-hydroxyacyl-CoA dehydrogenase NAD-binding domain-containing protein [Desulfuromonadales bacterium]